MQIQKPILDSDTGPSRAVPAAARAALRVMGLSVLLSCSGVGFAQVSAPDKLVSSCPSFEIEAASDLHINAELLDAMCTYYHRENSSDWQATYALRSNSFRRTVPFDRYSAIMARDQRGIAVTRLRVREAQWDRPNRLVLRVDFFEAREGDPLEDEYRSPKEKVIWENDGSWRCVACGVRTRYGLNHEF